MKSLVLTVLVSLFFSARAWVTNSPDIFGLRINGNVRENFPVAGLNSDTVTIKSNLSGTQPQDFCVKFYHCEENWEVTKKQFINDEMRNSTKFPIPFEHAPAGVEHHSYRYTVLVPGFSGVEQFPYLDNCNFEIWDREETALIAPGRFFVAEHIVPLKLSVGNRYLPSARMPFDHVNKIEASFVVPGDNTFGQDRLLPSLIRTMYVYKKQRTDLAVPC